MQDTELFFQAADLRHLFLYIDGLAEAAARRQADVCNYVKKHLDDYAALQKKVKRLERELQQEAARRQADADDYAALQKKVKRLARELQQEAARRQADADDYAALQKNIERLERELQQEAARRQADADDYAALQKNIERLERELQQEKDANALLQTQLAQQNSEAAVHSSRKTTTEDKQAGTAPAQNNAEDWYRLGEQYACGEGVPQDYDMACQCYAEAAAQGHKASLSALAQLAEVGIADAQNCLAGIYRRGGRRAAGLR